MLGWVHGVRMFFVREQPLFDFRFVSLDCVDGDCRYLGISFGELWFETVEYTEHVQADENVSTAMRTGTDAEIENIDRVVHCFCHWNRYRFDLETDRPAS